METIVWDEKLLSVGVRQFDEEHKELIKYLNNLNDAVKSQSSHLVMEEILLKMINYTHYHFSNEEKNMIHYKYPEYETHKQEHESLIEQVNDFYKRLKSGKSSFSLELLRFLYDWLIKHILGTDMKYKDFFLKAGITI
jgi:hemerythrin